MYLLSSKTSSTETLIFPYNFQFGGVIFAIWYSRQVGR